MKHLTFTAIALTLFHFQSLAQQVTPADFKLMMGNWEGTITYLDYNTNEPFSMPANLFVEQGNNPFTYTLSNSYPDEPKANNTDKLKIAKDGKSVNGKRISSINRDANGTVEVIAEYSGKDGNDNKKARIRELYILGADQLKFRKEVQFENTAEWIMRNEFSYQRR